MRFTLRPTERRLCPAGGTALLIPTDVSHREAVEKLIDKTVTQYNTIDILVNNAAKPGGQGPVPSLDEISEDLFWEDMNVKVLGYLRCIQATAPYMKKQGWGRIINISGMAARSTGSTIGSIRNVSISAMCKNLAEELGPHGINVTVVHPGMTRTEATAMVVENRARAEAVSYTHLPSPRD